MTSSYPLLSLTGLYTARVHIKRTRETKKETEREGERRKCPKAASSEENKLVLAKYGE